MPGGSGYSRDGRQCWDLWQEERRKLIALPERPFEARRVVLVPVSSKATVEIESARYSLPSRLGAAGSHGICGCGGYPAGVPR